ncbi:DoxX family protein [Marinicella sp. W31]|uniref:DoxX family protein n=1 Tax=Marinicella sp. W31 TaxID=3023713 RepID=UPI003757C25D
MPIIYWLTTGLVVIMLLLSAASYLYSDAAIEGFKVLGFPDYFRIQLVVLKLMAIIVLVMPNIPLMVKDWAYAGVGLFILTAIVGHAVHKDPLWFNAVNVCWFIALALSRYAYTRVLL